MNNRGVNFIKNFSYTLTSNLIAMLIAALVTLIVPKLIGIKEYGYWQLYLFYSNYVGFMHFGWNDGIYLRYGGKEYNDLNKKTLFSQFYMLVALQIIIAAIIVVISNFFIADINKIFILRITALCMIIINTRYMLIYILQATNRIREYAQITILDKMFYVLLISTFLFIGIREYKLLIIADLIGKLLSLLYAMYCCKDIIFQKIRTFYFGFTETVKNIQVGIKLMISNIASIMIIGVVRFGIERSWNVEIFGKISLALSISNLMMIFINAVGIVMFPILRRTDEKKFSYIYLTMRDFLMIILLGTLLIYYPLKGILSAWLPKYAISLRYMALIFPVCVYEGKMSLLINTYLKTMRKEKMMLNINFLTMIFSISITVLTTVILKNINLAVLSLVVLLAFRCIFAEIYLSRLIKIHIYKDIIFETIMTLAFIFGGWYLDSFIGILLYVVVYIIYLIIKRKDIICSFKNILLMIRS